MIKALLRLIGLRHRHDWRDTRFNVFCDSLEQQCRCGAARHIKGWDDIDMSGGYPGVKRWHNGPYIRPTNGA